MLRKIVNINWLQHLLFWLLSFYTIGSYFSISSWLKIIDFIYSFFFHIPLLILVYLNIKWIVPNYFSYNKIYLFGLLNCFNVGFAMLLHELLFEITIPVLPIEFYIVSFVDLNVLASIFILYIAITTLLKLSKSWFQLQKAEQENTYLELNALKSQVNPHFLFNTLNSIYSLSLNNSAQTPEVVLKLSQLLRYMLYEVTEEKVNLSKEVGIMNDYLELQKIRLDETCNIQFDVDLDDQEIMIPPLLFFPLIENSFKHGLKGLSRNSFVNISLENKQDYLYFEIENNKGDIDETEDEKYRGIGLENVKRRIDFVYKKESTFEIVDSSEKFTIKLNFKY